MSVCVDRAHGLVIDELDALCKQGQERNRGCGRMYTSPDTLFKISFTATVIVRTSGTWATATLALRDGVGLTVAGMTSIGFARSSLNVEKSTFVAIQMIHSVPMDNFVRSGPAVGLWALERVLTICPLGCTGAARVQSVKSNLRGEFTIHRGTLQC